MRIWVLVSHRFGGQLWIWQPIPKVMHPTHHFYTVRDDEARKSTVDVLSWGKISRTLEGLIHAQSNTLQQLHHSFNFYFLTSPVRHISNGMYVYPLAACLLPLVAYFLSGSVAHEVHNIALGLSLLLASIIMGSGVSYALVTQDLFGQLMSSNRLMLTPSCSPMRSSMAPLYKVKVTIWVLAMVTGYIIAAVCVFIASFVHSRNQTKRMNNHTHQTTSTRESTSERGIGKKGIVKDKVDMQGEGVVAPAASLQYRPVWASLRTAARIWGVMFLGPLLILNWSLCLFLGLVMVPVLVMMRPITAHLNPSRFTDGGETGDGALESIPAPMKRRRMVGLQLRRIMAVAFVIVSFSTVLVVFSPFTTPTMDRGRSLLKTNIHEVALKGHRMLSKVQKDGRRLPPQLRRYLPADLLHYVGAATQAKDITTSKYPRVPGYQLSRSTGLASSHNFNGQRINSTKTLSDTHSPRQQRVSGDKLAEWFAAETLQEYWTKWGIRAWLEWGTMGSLDNILLTAPLVGKWATQAISFVEHMEDQLREMTVRVLVNMSQRSSDTSLWIYRHARDAKCINSLLLPILWFTLIPYLVVVFIITFVLVC
eukprot:GHVN01020621.1.p1 GENE.GHVN01020621.1~~GHVN01020621.1.p1  ORF type:complete len:593 (+),score=83.83 GHVN01020621.1:1499-3277(+)